MIINISDVWDNVAADHTLYLTHTIAGGLALLDNLPRPEEQYVQLVREFIVNNSSVLLGPKSTYFGTVINDFNTKFSAPGRDRDKAIDILKRIFDYGKFTNKHEPGWNAYKLCIGARWRVCPYCHLQGTETVLPAPGIKGYRPNLDHYLAKADFPYLALSLGNLIPACEKCNGPSMKHTQNFHLIPHLNPLCDAQCIDFKIEAKDPVLSDMPDVKAFRRSVDHYQVALVAPTNDAKSAASLQTFQLVSRYQQYVGQAHKLARNVSRKTWPEMMVNAVGIRVKKTDYLPFDPASSPYQNEVAGKLYLDIYKQACT